MVRVGSGGPGVSLGTHGRSRCVLLPLFNRACGKDLCCLIYAYHTCSQAFRKINAVTVPKIVGVPKNDEEDAARGNQ